MSIYKKLLKVQKEVGAISKDSKNPFFKSKYFDVNALIKHVEPLLTKNGLLLLQPIIEGKQFSKIIDTESEELSFVECGLELPTLNDPQKLGSAITYYRRYTLCSLLALQSEDDDGNRAAHKPEPKKEVVDKNKMIAHQKDLEGCKSLDELGKIWKSITPLYQIGVLAVKEEMKTKLTK